MTLGELIKQYRLEHDMSQRQFAASCNLSNGYIAMVERNENPKTGQPIVPTIPRLKALSDGMGMTLDDLFRAVDDMPVDLGAPALTNTESQLVAKFRQLSPEHQDAVMQIVSTMALTDAEKNNAPAGLAEAN